MAEVIRSSEAQTTSRSLLASRTQPSRPVSLNYGTFSKPFETKVQEYERIRGLRGKDESSEPQSPASRSIRPSPRSCTTEPGLRGCLPAACLIWSIFSIPFVTSVEDREHILVLRGRGGILAYDWLPSPFLASRQDRSSRHLCTRHGGLRGCHLACSPIRRTVAIPLRTSVEGCEHTSSRPRGQDLRRPRQARVFAIWQTATIPDINSVLEKLSEPKNDSSRGGIPVWRNVRRWLGLVVRGGNGIREHLILIQNTSKVHKVDLLCYSQGPPACHQTPVSAADLG